jgi:hypothetical protein
MSYTCGRTPCLNSPASSVGLSVRPLIVWPRDPEFDPFGGYLFDLNSRNPRTKPPQFNVSKQMRGTIEDRGQRRRREKRGENSEDGLESFFRVFQAKIVSFLTAVFKLIYKISVSIQQDMPEWFTDSAATSMTFERQGSGPGVVALLF